MFGETATDPHQQLVEVFTLLRFSAKHDEILVILYPCCGISRAGSHYLTIKHFEICLKLADFGLHWRSSARSASI